jgi:cytochrome P450
MNRNTELAAQRGYSTLADCMLSQIRWHQAGAEVNPFGFLNVARWYVHWSNGRQMDRLIGRELDKRYNEYKSDPENMRRKAVIDLVLQAYIPESESAAVNPEKLDPGFRAFAIRQVRLFLFVGHDSTSSTVCYALHLLATNPETLARIRAEHDEVFGSDVSAASSILEKNPSLANSLPYTTGVLKEAMRLFPPASASRAGKPNEYVTDDQGNHCPTAGVMLFVIHIEMQRSPKYWKRADEFLPERWLVEPGHELYPMKGAWRPFEHGPRNCIAQSLVMTELRIILACVVREFDFKPAYDEWDRLHPRRGIKTYKGERAYQVEEGAAHPVNHYPCRVSLRNPKS